MIKKIIVYGFALILLLIALASLGPIIAMAISLAITYFGFKQFLKTDSTLGKIFWGIVVLIGFSGLVSNLPGFVVGGIAAYLLYVGYKKHKGNEEEIIARDPFANFDKQWDEINKNNI
ncbi:flagellar basal body rod protein [Bacillus aquiflavi]|uniref:lmo0954 family membrane protein n=1 Tax=Bacillus aquiflavi TaxID=2672567 RepID=UPI001CA85223|nr:flagellar basal body rod protein [Bacillus aquiflavi]UAC48892.1 flagellar basal body rod protein [Bacillus aquiflavi]